MNREAPPPGFPLNLVWRPSQWQALILALLAIASPLAIVMTGMPALLRWPLALAVLVGTLWSLHRYRHSRPGRLHWSRPDLPATWHESTSRATPAVGPGVDADPSGGEPGRTLTVVAIAQRGPILTMRLENDEQGAIVRLVWWPDTLTVAERRCLILAGGSHRRATGSSLMAG